MQRKELFYVVSYLHLLMTYVFTHKIHYAQENKPFQIHSKEKLLLNTNISNFLVSLSQSFLPLSRYKKHQYITFNAKRKKYVTKLPLTM